MGFAREVKLELGTVPAGAAHCRRAELSGILYGAGTFEIGAGGHLGVRVSLALPATARRALALLKPMGVEASLRTATSAPIGLRYEVVLGGDGTTQSDLQLLNDVGVLSDDLRVQMTVPRRVIERRCCVVAFLRGLFLGCGSISAPGSPVHAEFTFEDAGLAEQACGLLTRLDLAFKVAERDRNHACYSKRSETAAGLLAVLGAHDARLRWDESAVMGTVRESANRLANCDEANARRAAGAAARQAAAARALMESSTWDGVPDSIREAACLRLDHPYLTLVELAEEARPALTKSALNHRLRKLEALAAELER